MRQTPGGGGKTKTALRWFHDRRQRRKVGNNWKAGGRRQATGDKSACMPVPGEPRTIAVKATVTRLHYANRLTVQ